MLKILYLLAGFALFFACNIAAFAQSNPPAATARTESQTPQTKNQSDPKDNQRRTESAPLAVKILPAENTDKPATKISDEEQKQSSSDWWLIVPTWILAIMAFIGNLLTAWLVIGSQKTAESEFRAYIVGVALFGIPKGPPGPKEQYRPKASDYTGPWRLHILNFGKTPGVILKVEWGRCPEREFPKQTSISDIIDNNLLPNRMQRTIIGMNEICLSRPKAAAIPTH
jgi:hypothetical protein